jgi:hypothetical protein
VAYRQDTIKVSDLSFAPIGAGVDWTVTGVTGLRSIATLLLRKDFSEKTILLAYEDTDLPEAFTGFTESNLQRPVVSDCCAFVELTEIPISVTAGVSPVDTSGGDAEVFLGDNIHIWSDTLEINISDGTLVRIEKAYPDPPEVVGNGVPNQTGFLGDTI